jgi:3-dehydrosphinganine reductase
MTFHNRVILITGGSSGIGLATARAFAREGAHVWLVARNPGRLAQALSEVQSSCKSASQRCGMVSADVTDPDQAASAIATVVAQAGVPDFVVNSHGAAHPGYFHELDLAAFHGMMDVNYFGALHVIKAVVGGMMARRSGHIVNVASGAALLPTYGYAAYSASKYALRGLSDVLRIELKPYRIRLSVVYPPDTDTPSLAAELPDRVPEMHAVYGGTVISADSVARDILNGIRHNRYSIVPSLEMSAAARAASLLGDLQFLVLDQLISRARRRQEHESRPK